MVQYASAEIIKLSELIRAYRNDQNVCVLYTGQHYSHEMKDEFFDELDIASVQEGAGWKKIAALPRLFPEFVSKP